MVFFVSSGAFGGKNARHIFSRSLALGFRISTTNFNRRQNSDWTKTDVVDRSTFASKMVVLGNVSMSSSSRITSMRKRGEDSRFSSGIAPPSMWLPKDSNPVIHDFQWPSNLKPNTLGSIEFPNTGWTTNQDTHAFLLFIRLAKVKAPLAINDTPRFFKVNNAPKFLLHGFVDNELV
ncbi:hypothetical protein PsorP6_001556 [Peronosclerospora sorghi]|uniref:Uncharacterized protein n=1 Tax=Peronosclerospora sorghi TaxID=230839 RepID=A0ACC0WT92_9STRA|nr:hypothetical protein PsorP6_001556 [Peronosclerospora sorghi]